MTPELYKAVDQERVEQQEAARNEAKPPGYSVGVFDAFVGLLPRFKDEDYLRGYLAGTRELPTNSDGTIARSISAGKTGESEDQSTRPMFEVGHGDETMRGVDSGDCDWLYGEEF